MDSVNTLTWSYLNCLTKKRYDALQKEFGTLDTALRSLDAKLLRSLSCREDTIETVLMRHEEFQPEWYLQELEKRDLTLISIEDDLYPEKLREIGDPPIFLYYRGDISILSQPSIALVGSREMTDYGKRVTEFFVQQIVSAGLVTVSGLAIGIDEHVARETLRAGGLTVAVLGHGLSQILPSRNKKLAEEICSSGGVILSEFPLDIAPGKYTFPARNRIIAGLTLGTVVLQAGESSGAIITSDLALDYGRDVFAVPGQIFDPAYAGCNAEISKGHALLVLSPNQVLAELGIIVPEEREETFVPESQEESLIFSVLSSMPQTVEEIFEKSQVPTGTLNGVLTMLELKDAVKNVGRGLWVRR